MNDAGMFDIIIDKLVKKAGNNVVAITVVTAIIGHLDGATATTVLVNYLRKKEQEGRIKGHAPVVLLISTMWKTCV